LNIVLKRYRTDRKMTHLEMAQFLGVPRPTYTYLEHGRRPSFKQAVNISQKIGMPIEEIFLPPNVQNV